MQMNKPQSQSTTSLHSSGAHHDESKRIDRLFLRFAIMYGHVWRTLYKNESFLDTSKEEWQDGLQKFDNQDIKEAIMLCREQCNYPPTLPQFIDFCRSSQNRHIPYQRLVIDQMPAPSAAGTAALAQIKKILNMKQ